MWFGILFTSIIIRTSTVNRTPIDISLGLTGSLKIYNTILVVCFTLEIVPKLVIHIITITFRKVPGNVTHTFSLNPGTHQPQKRVQHIRTYVFPDSHPHSNFAFCVFVVCCIANFPFTPHTLNRVGTEIYLTPLFREDS